MTPTPGTKAMAVSLAALVVLAGCTTAPGSGDDAVPVELSEEQISAAATTLVDQHGGVEGFAITLVAMDQGYSAPQIVEHADAMAWRSLDTPVLPVDPARGEAGLLIMADEVTTSGGDPETLLMAWGPALRTDADGDGLAQDLQMRHPGEQALAIIDAYTDWVTYVERVDTEADVAAPAEPASFRDVRTIMFIVALLNRGYSPEQVVAAIILNDVENPGPRMCPRIPGEAPDFTDNMAETNQCRPIEGTPAVSEESAPAEPETTTPAGGDEASWTGPIEVDEPSFGEVSDSFIAVDRAGDGSFALTLFIESTRGPAGECLWSAFHEADATGDLSPDGTEIMFSGSYSIDETVEAGADCAASDYDGEFTMVVDVNGGTLTGSPFPYTEFSISGSPVAP